MTDREDQSWILAQDIKKSEFALRFAINETDWVIPRYIDEGLRWLGQIDSVATEPSLTESQVKEDTDA